MQYFLLALKNYFKISGRARRAEYGWFFLISFLIGFVVIFLAGVAEGIGLFSLSSLLKFVAVISDILLFIPSITVTTRRLHDLGYSGWWQLGIIIIIILIATCLSIVLFNFIQNTYMIVGLVATITLALFLIYLITLIFKDGKPQANKYGISPKYSDLSENNEKDITPIS